MIFDKNDIAYFEKIESANSGDLLIKYRLSKSTGVFFNCVESAETKDFMYFSVGTITSMLETENTKTFTGNSQADFFAAVDYFEKLIAERKPKQEKNPPSVGYFIYSKTGPSIVKGITEEPIMIDKIDVYKVFTPPQKKPFGRLNMLDITGNPDYDLIRGKFALKYDEDESLKYNGDGEEDGDFFAYKMTPYNSDENEEGDPDDVNDEDLSAKDIEDEEEKGMKGDDENSENEDESNENTESDEGDESESSDGEDGDSDEKGDESDEGDSDGDNDGDDTGDDSGDESDEGDSADTEGDPADTDEDGDADDGGEGEGESDQDGDGDSDQEGEGEGDGDSNSDNEGDSEGDSEGDGGEGDADGDGEGGSDGDGNDESGEGGDGENDGENDSGDGDGDSDENNDNSGDSGKGENKDNRDGKEDFDSKGNADKQNDEPQDLTQEDNANTDGGGGGESGGEGRSYDRQAKTITSDMPDVINKLNVELGVNDLIKKFKNADRMLNVIDSTYTDKEVKEVFYPAMGVDKSVSVPMFKKDLRAYTKPFFEKN